MQMFMNKSSSNTNCLAEKKFGSRPAFSEQFGFTCMMISFAGQFQNGSDDYCMPTQLRKADLQALWRTWHLFLAGGTLWRTGVFQIGT